MASVLNRLAAGPVSPMVSIAAIPASTAGDSAVAEPWKTSTFTFAPPGGDGRDNVVAGGLGYGSALATLPPPSSDAVMAPTPSAAARRRFRDLVLPDL
ncbi:hypothetical protein GCM10010271_04760 [Streptomyces kurssanovii]|nr:hypothetical protein GCM10010271_04760 [Streptomyces kurssanovii]